MAVSIHPHNRHPELVPGSSSSPGGEAEDWLASTWSELLGCGVDQVLLTEGTAEVYGPKSLHPPQH